MKEKIIHFDNKKRIKLLVISLILLAFCLSMICLNLCSERVQLVSLILFGLIAIGAVVMQAMTLKAIFSKNQNGLVMDQDGILFHGTELGRQLGLILWQDVASLRSGSAHRVKQLFVQFKEPHKYVGRISSRQTQHLLVEQGFPLNASELDIDFFGMETLVMQYYHQYHDMGVTV